MNKAGQFISHLVYNKFFWQLLLAFFMIGMAAFFIKNEHIELIQIKDQLATSRPDYIILGVILTVVYIGLQGQMYVHSFKALGNSIPIDAATLLFLKRNLVSVFLPAGGFSSLAFFTKEIENHGPTRSQIHLASTLFAFCSLLSVIIVGLPAIGIAFLFHSLQTAALLGFAFLIILTIGFIIVMRSVAIKGRAYYWVSRTIPSTAVILNEMISQKIDRKQFLMTLIASIGIEIVGIIHLYVAMLALGFDPSWPAAFIGYIVMVILLIASPFLRGLGAIEVSLTYVLGQFGYPIIAAATITLLFRLFEFWIPLFAGILSFLTKRDNLILRVLPSIIIFVLGLVNIISAITPAIPARLRLVRNLIPEEIISTGNTMVLVFGLLLLILSIFLLQGSKRAWTIGIFLTGFSVVGHLLKAADYEEALLALVAASSLMYTRRFYKLKPHPKLTQIGYQVLLYSIVAVFIYGVVGLYFIDKKHFGIDFHFWNACELAFKLFFLFDDSGLNPTTSFGRYFLYSMYFSGGAVLSFIFFSVLKPYFAKPYNTEKDRMDAINLVKLYGNSALDYFKTYPDKFYYFTNDRQAFISFKVTRHFAFVLEGPVYKDAASFNKIVKSFDEFCDENGFVNVYYRVSDQALPMFKALKKKSLPIGEEAIVDLRTFALEGGKMKTTRSAINRLESEGYKAQIHQPPIKEGLLQKLEQVSNNWLKELGREEVAFTQGVFDRSILKEQTIITIEDDEEKIYAFVNIVPDFAPGEATYDLIRKVSDAPNGVLDMILAKTLLYMKEKGCLTANLGLAPMSGIEGINLTEKTIKYAYENLKVFGHFKGLRKYKDKFFPRWEKKYLVYNHDYHLLQVPNALKRVSKGS
ncbi:MAG: lysylphosphatidylglycerol synthetase family protein [Cyclobacteriaceae bacterium]|nr:lysylphosphatidylglycerol synthetase family protein [Cyclobacteriaceae bacterium]